MFQNISITEILIFALILIILFGGKKISELAKGAGQAGRELKNVSKEIRGAKEDIKKEEDGL
jgi:sec-independent protein translocase protein TatA